MRQYAGFTSAKESNKRYHSLIEQGVMGLSIAFDLPTQIGYDSDNRLAKAKLGKLEFLFRQLKIWIHYLKIFPCKKFQPR